MSIHRRTQRIIRAGPLAPTGVRWMAGGLLLLGLVATVGGTPGSAFGRIQPSRIQSGMPKTVKCPPSSCAILAKEAVKIGSVQPTGWVTFSQGSTPLAAVGGGTCANVPLVTGHRGALSSAAKRSPSVATCDAVGLSSGKDAITLAYSGDDTYPPRTTTERIKVAPLTIQFVSESYSAGAYHETVAGSGYTPGGEVWIGIAVDTRNENGTSFSWSYDWGTDVAATSRDGNVPGGAVEATITVTDGTASCRDNLGLAASDQTSGVPTPPAPASDYGGHIPATQVNNTSAISDGTC